MNRKITLKPSAFILALLSFFFIDSLYAGVNEAENVEQAITVTGVVTDLKDEPLIAVTVMVKGTSTGTVTDLDGQFTLNVPTENSVLVFSYLGYSTVEVPVKGQRRINVVLQDDAKLLDEVVVVAYGVQNKATVTGAISTVKGNALLEVPAANVTNTLAGKLPGVTVSQTNGRPGEDAANIYIRGRATWVDSSPLIIIDGIEQERFDQLDPNEIESISILKDASSTAVYGIRGANGVILITTKRGNEGKPHISLTANWGIQNPTKTPEFLGSYEHLLLKRVAYDNDGMEYLTNMRDDYLEGFRLGLDPYKYPDVNWYDLMIKGTNNLMQQYNVNISGGTQRVKYFVSLGYLDQDGAVNYQDIQKEYNPKAYFRRINLRANLDLKLNKYLTASVNLSGRSEEKNGVSSISGSTLAEGGGSGGYYQGLLSREPWQLAPFNPDGSIGETGTQASPIATAAFSGYQNQKINYYDVIGALNADLGFITKGLTFDFSYSLNNRYGSTKTYSDGVDTYYYNPLTEEYTQIKEDSPFRFGTERTVAAFKRTALQLKLAYSRTIDEHRISSVLVYNQQKTFDPGSGSTEIYSVPYTLMGYAARVEYSYASKYLGEVSLGYNGSENFAKGYRFGFFPAGSLGYVLSEENFMKPISRVLPFFKVRGSIGLVGNDKGQARFLYMGEYVSIPSPGNASGNAGWLFGTTNPTGSGGIYEQRGENRSLTWETGLKKNIGFEAQLFGRQLFTITGDLFSEDRRDILMASESTPALIGQTSPYGNIGRVKSWGYELEVIHRNKINQVEYSIKGNYNFARNKVKYRDDPVGTPEYQKQAGYRIGQLRGYRVLGFFQSAEEIANSPNQETLSGNIIPGDLKYEDVNGDGIINSEDMVPIGYSTVPEITYSITPSITWKNITFSCMFQGVANASMLFTGNAIYEFSTNSGGQVSKMHLDYWTPDNPNASYPSLHYGPHSNKNANSLLLQSANYLKLRNINLSYNLPVAWCKKMHMSSVQIYINGSNLCTWTKMYNWDPETINSSGDYFPQQKVWNLGVNINF